jgi:two-component system, chemotaxis family, CheB/CheR fusion protein
MSELNTADSTSTVTQSLADKSPLTAGGESNNCLVVAIGVSEESLPGLACLLGNLSPTLGLTYIIAQNVPAHGIPILPKTLEALTAMPVCKGEAGMRIVKDRVYILAAESNMTVKEDILTPATSVRKADDNYPIDIFLSGLAASYRERAIAIILSRKTNDGSTGIQAICREGGITFALDDRVLFPQMPELAVQSGFIDATGSPVQIAEKLTGFAQYHRDRLRLVQPEEERKDLGVIYQLLLERHKFDFSFFRQNMIERRIRRRMTIHRLYPLVQYLGLLGRDSNELDLLYKDLLLDIKGFFREPALYQSLIKTVLPALLKDRTKDDAVRIWIPACNTGESAWSLAIFLMEYWREKQITQPVMIFASDSSEQAIAIATKGVYASGSMQNISERRVKQFFERRNKDLADGDKEFQVSKTIRDLCSFAVHNLLKDPPITDIDLICCENVTIRMGPMAKDSTIKAFHYALKPSGYLLPGKLDTMPDNDSPFCLHESVWRVYSKKKKSG